MASKWTDAEERRLLELAALQADGSITWAEVGDRMDRTANACRFKARRLRNRQTQERANGEAGAVPASDTVEVSGVSEHRITSLAELYEFFDVPYYYVHGERCVSSGERIPDGTTCGCDAIPISDEYEVTSFRINSWEQHSVKKGVVTLYQVRANLRPRQPEESLAVARQAIADMLADAAEHMPAHFDADCETPAADDPVLLELAVCDPHIGMLAWDAEVGVNYDSSIALQDYAAAVERLLSFAGIYPVERILYLVGNDFLHVDGPAGDPRSSGSSRGGATTAGTQQDIDTRLAKMFTAGRRALVSGIDKARSLAPVDVLVVPGNHDEQQMYRIAEVLSAWYRSTEGVNVLYGPNRRKYYRYGNNAFMFTHGVEYKRQRDNLPLIFATECPPDMWAETTHREVHTGHNHVTKGGRVYHPELELNETRGIRTRSLPGLTPEDAWHYHQGYHHKRAASALAFRRSGGPIGVHEFHID